MPYFRSAKNFKYQEFRVVGLDSTSLDQCCSGPLPCGPSPLHLHLWSRHFYVVPHHSGMGEQWWGGGLTLSTYACIFIACFVLDDLLMDDNRQSKIAWRKLLTRFTLMWRSTISQLVSSHKYFIHLNYNQEASSAMNLQLEVNCSSCSWQVE